MLQRFKTARSPTAASSTSRADRRTASDGSPRIPTRTFRPTTSATTTIPAAGDTDAQVGEAFVATFVNAIARSTYWNDSAIIITWDDPGGYYDHVPPPQAGAAAPTQRPCGDGPRLPFILISPYARDGGRSSTMRATRRRS